MTPHLKTTPHLRKKFIAFAIAGAETFASVVHASAPLHEAEGAHQQTEVRNFNGHASGHGHSEHMPGGYNKASTTTKTSKSGHGQSGNEAPHKDGGHGGGSNEHVPHRERRERDNRRSDLHFETPPRRSQYGEYHLDASA